jgi:hypothetical protein
MSTIATRPQPTAPPIEIVISGGKAGRRESTRSLPIDDVLLNALPAARRVLAIGCGDGQLEHAYRRRQAGAQWRDANHLSELANIDAAYDLIVLGSGLGLNPEVGTGITAASHRPIDPQQLLETLGDLATADATLVLQLKNSATLSAIERLIETDLTESCDRVGEKPRSHSPSSVYKLLMDAGWMPSLAGWRDAEPIAEGVTAAAMAMADVLDVPRRTVLRTLSIDKFVVCAKRPFGPATERSDSACFDVVVPTTRERQLRLNIAQSPGLREVDAHVVSCRHASSAADALQQALPHCTGDWVLLCHQDVYFPSGFGQRLNALLASVPVDERQRTLIGFVGMGVNATMHSYEPAGFVIDRLHAADHPASDKAVSIDELAIVIARDSIHSIDPALGWHLWGTDLCLTAICQHQVFPHIVRLPLFHNSVNDYQLPPAFFDSAALLAQKHASFGPIPTLCGTINAAFLGQAAAAVPTSPPAPQAVATAPPALPPQRCNARRELLVDDIDQEVARHLAKSDCASAMRSIAAGVHQTYRRPEFERAALYYPQLDQHIEQLARLLPVAQPDSGKARRGALIIATELYELGGHSRVLEDISHEVDRAVVVLTDLFDTYDRQPEMIDLLTQRFEHCTLVVVPAGSGWDKAQNLRRLADAMEPRHILYFGHHQDPIPFVATLSMPQTRKVLFHHGDHNPSLGCTIAELVHVDLSKGAQDVCANHLSSPPRLLPLHAPDRGVKIFPEVCGTDFSVVSSGHPAKFMRNGPMALQLIVQAALKAVRGAYHHIGPLDDGWVKEIRQFLRAHAIDPDRFVHHGLVPSLWDHLKLLDAAVYIGSAPIGGGRAAIEAQGCGYPLAYFESAQAYGLADNKCLYASRRLKWATPEELATVLALAGSCHGELSQQARQLYLDTHSNRQFKHALKQMLQG